MNELNISDLEVFVGLEDNEATTMGSTDPTATDIAAKTNSIVDTYMIASSLDGDDEGLMTVCEYLSHQGVITFADLRGKSQSALFKKDGAPAENLEPFLDAIAAYGVQLQH